MSNEYGVCFDQDTALDLFRTNDGLVYFKLHNAIPIYYGSNSLPHVTESIITSTFLTSIGYVGSLAGNHYIFPSEYAYKYWCIPDYANDGSNGEKLIDHITSVGATYTVLAWDSSYYKYFQTNPTPAISVTYGKIEIFGEIYRIYRSQIKTSSYSEQIVYSF